MREKIQHEAVLSNHSYFIAFRYLFCLRPLVACFQKTIKTDFFVK